MISSVIRSACQCCMCLAKRTHIPCLWCLECSFSSFGFKWPTILSKMYNIASMSSFNEQFLAPECSVGGWSFQLKYVPRGALSIEVLCSPVLALCRKLQQLLSGTLGAW